jgi:hypothetical protein
VDPGGYVVSSTAESGKLPRDLGSPPPYEISLEYEPIDDAEERLLMVYEILLSINDETTNEDEKPQETA